LPGSYSALLKELGDYAGTDLLEIADYIDHVSPPRLNMWDVTGNRLDWVQLNPAHRDMLYHLMDTGIVHRTFTENSPWQLHYAMGYLIADPGIFCTITLTNQTAYALYKYGTPELKSKFLARFLEKDGSKAWFGATFYTEIQGGSDLGANRARAVEDGDRWQISSEEKYFASNAGIADGALVTARPEGRPEGPKGLALFFVPALRTDGTANYTIRRLKEKLATRAVPTGEVVLQNSEAYLLGSPETGIYQAMEILTLARLANAMGALGIARKAYLEALFYTQNRNSFGEALIAHPLIKRDLLEMEAEIEANLLLGMKAIEAFDKSWKAMPPYTEDYDYARLLAHILKNMSAEMSAVVTQTAMELHGGIGFLEDFPVARWHREALITPIWEGGSNIQALDMLESLVKKQAHLRLFSELEPVLVRAAQDHPVGILVKRIESLKSDIEYLGKLGPVDSQFYAKDLLRSLGECAAATFLMEAGFRMIKEHGDYRFRKIAEVYIHKHLLKDRMPLPQLKSADQIIRISERVKDAG